jgi:rare lipoprotein A
MTAAHRSLPFGTKIRVTNKRNGKSVVVRINDRGPFIRGRVLDVSKAAARQLGFIGAGHTAVCMART